MSWRRNFADYQNSLSQKSADKLIEEFIQCYDKTAEEIIPMFMEVYEEALASVDNKRDLAPATLFNLDDYWTLQKTSKKRVNNLGHLVISLMNYQFHVMYADVFEGITPGGIKVPCFIPPEMIQNVIDGVWGVDKRNWKERVWINMTHLWDNLTGELMESIIKHRDSNILQTKLKEVFDGSRKSLNSTMMIDVSRIQSKAAMMRYRVSRKMATSKSVDIAAYTMTYGNEAEICALAAEDVAAVNTLSATMDDEVVDANAGIMTTGIFGSILDFISDLFDVLTSGGKGDENQRYLWVCEGDDLVCEACAEYDGEIITGAEADEIYPLHPNCRCVLEPLEDDEDEDGEDDVLDPDDFSGGTGGAGDGFSDMMDDLGGYLNSIGTSF